MSADAAGERTDGRSESGAETTGADPADLAARVEFLEEENRRLREEYGRARRTRYRRTAVGLGVVGLLGLAGAAAFPRLATVLLSLGATGVFAAVLTYYLTPERFIAADVGEAVYAARAATGDEIVGDLGLTAERVYVPTDGPDAPARLFVPQSESYELPAVDDLAAPFAATDDERRRGVSLHPTGARLFREFERTLAGPLSDDPATLADQLADGVVEAFELAASATPDVDPDRGRATVGVAGSAYGAVDRFDHPIASFVAVGLAVGLDRPVSLDVAAADDDRYDYVVTCRWSLE